MTANAFHNIAQIETSLWDAADQLRANSNLTATEYSMPVLGVIFLRHATPDRAASHRGHAGGGHHAQAPLGQG
jgi:type I restriction enzyme M protein